MALPTDFNNLMKAIFSGAYDETLTALKLTLVSAIAGEDTVNDVLKVEERSGYATPLTASGLVKTGAGRLMGLFVSAAAATPTIKVWDNTAGSGQVLIDTFTPVAGTMYSLPSVEFSTGIYITIGGTVTVTPFFK